MVATPDWREFLRVCLLAGSKRCSADRESKEGYRERGPPEEDKEKGATSVCSRFARLKNKTSKKKKRGSEEEEEEEERGARKTHGKIGGAVDGGVGSGG